MFDTQIFVPSDIGVVLFLTLLEGLLSADNALVLAIMVKHLPKKQQGSALSWGLAGSYVFRGIAIVVANMLIKFWWLQAIGAAYLIYLPVKHFVKSHADEEREAKDMSYWKTVLAVQLADVAFAMDSVLAAVAMVKDAHKVWIVYVGALLGIVLLRFAAGVFIRLLEKYPTLDHLAYVLVGWVGLKLAMMSAHNYTRSSNLAEFPEMPQPVFWAVMAIMVVGGTWLSVKRPATPNESASDEQA